MSTKKILFILFQSSNSANGGVESISQIIKNLRSFEKIIVTQLDTKKNTQWIEQGIPVFTWRLSLGQIISILFFNYRVFKLCLRTKNLACVHCNDINAMLYGSIGARLAGKRVVFNVRDIKSNSKDYGVKWRWASKIANKIVVLSKDMERLLKRNLSLRPKKVTYIYSIVDFDKFQIKSTEKPIQLDSRGFVVGVVAAVFVKKQQLQFLQLAGSIVKEWRDISIYFIGDFKPETEEYAKLCQEELNKQNLSDRVHFVGYQPNMEEWYQTLDVNLVISEREGLARGMIESLSVGTPVISFDVPSAREILENHECGIVVNQGDYKALAEAIVNLKNNPDVIKLMSDNATQVTRQLFNANSVIEQYEKIYLN
ncbi:MAG TPA: glycosyltransferase [Fulvivirga sp.]|nr:glycosyltransferase [Fulvivirga sp.]